MVVSREGTYSLNISSCCYASKSMLCFPKMSVQCLQALDISLVRSSFHLTCIQWLFQPFQNRLLLGKLSRIRNPSRNGTFRSLVPQDIHRKDKDMTLRSTPWSTSYWTYDRVVADEGLLCFDWISASPAQAGWGVDSTT